MFSYLWSLVYKSPSVAEQLAADIKTAKADLRAARLAAVKAQATVQWRVSHLAALEAEYVPYADRRKSA